MKEHSIPTAGMAERSIMRFSRFLSSGHFAMFVLWVLFFYEVFVAVMTFAPIPGGATGAFLEDFRVRCYQFEPKTGMMQWSSVFVMLAEPMPLGGIVCFIWWAQIGALWREQRRRIPPLFFSALLVVVLIGAGLAGVSHTGQSTRPTVSRRTPPQRAADARVSTRRPGRQNHQTRNSQG